MGGATFAQRCCSRAWVWGWGATPVKLGLAVAAVGIAMGNERAMHGALGGGDKLRTCEALNDLIRTCRRTPCCWRWRRPSSVTPSKRGASSRCPASARVSWARSRTQSVSSVARLSGAVQWSRALGSCCFVRAPSRPGSMSRRRTGSARARWRQRSLLRGRARGWPAGERSLGRGTTAPRDGPASPHPPETLDARLTGNQAKSADSRPPQPQLPEESQLRNIVRARSHRTLTKR